MTASVIRDYWTLTKPRVVLLMLITAWVGMLLAMPGGIAWAPFCWGTLGIGLTAGASAVINHLVEQQIDMRMRRTQNRPVASGRVNATQAITFAIVLATVGLSTLFFMVNTLTCWLTALTMIGYAFIYTLLLKKASPQNIVIGGLAGALPPLLGWTSVTGQVDANSWLLVLIIFTWTPPHFWALAINRRIDYEKSGLPMLPVTHGVPFTKLSILLYTLLLFPVTLLPYLTGLFGLIYAVGATLLNTLYLWSVIRIFLYEENKAALDSFFFSIVYLFLLFILMIWDHFYQWVLI
ncbi:MAG: protoheme IX farnesyltransferase [Legionellales bacterium]|nr:protoheme IX farnesyltransferase [Legionellales bacterium]